MGKARPVVSDRMEWYPSASAAAMSTGVSVQTICRSLKRGWDAAGRRWAYDDKGAVAAMTGEERERARRLMEMRRDPRDDRHGTPYGYSLGCRCTACKMARGMRDKAEEVLS